MFSLFISIAFHFIFVILADRGNYPYEDTRAQLFFRTRTRIFTQIAPQIASKIELKIELKIALKIALKYNFLATQNDTFSKVRAYLVKVPFLTGISVYAHTRKVISRYMISISIS